MQGGLVFGVAVGAGEVDTGCEAYLPPVLKVVREVRDTMDIYGLKDNGAEQLLFLVGKLELRGLEIDLFSEGLGGGLKLIEAGHKLPHGLIRDGILVKAFEHEGGLIEVGTSDSPDGNLGSGLPTGGEAVIDYLTGVEDVSPGGVDTTANLEVTVGCREGVHLLHVDTSESEANGVTTCVHLLSSDYGNESLLAQRELERLTAGGHHVRKLEVDASKVLSTTATIVVKESNTVILTGLEVEQNLHTCLKLGVERVLEGLGTTHSHGRSTGCLCRCLATIGLDEVSRGQLVEHEVGVTLGHGVHIGESLGLEVKGKFRCSSVGHSG
jgi:hypothetical protein